MLARGVWHVQNITSLLGLTTLHSRAEGGNWQFVCTHPHLNMALARSTSFTFSSNSANLMYSSSCRKHWYVGLQHISVTCILTSIRLQLCWPYRGP